MDKALLLQRVLNAGAAKAAYVTQDQIVLSAQFRDICKTNQCGSYGMCWMCPPFIGDIHSLMEKVRAFSGGLLYQTISGIEDSFDIEGMFEAGHQHAQVSQTIREAIAPLMDADSLHLSCGGCHLCETCARREDQPCRQPDKALSSMEGYGIDVYRTAGATDLKYINGPNTVTYFGIILF